MLNFIVSCTAIIVFSDVNHAVKDVTEGAEYEFRVAAINESGAGDPSPPSEMVCAKNPNSKLLTVSVVSIHYLTLLSRTMFVSISMSCLMCFLPVKPCFKDPEDFIVVRAGNSVRVNICYEVRTSLKAGMYTASFFHGVNPESIFFHSFNNPLQECHILE